MEYSIIIKNDNIFDGTGNPWIKTDMGVVKDKIKKLVEQLTRIFNVKKLKNISLNCH